ncbi:hypothetical protein ACFFJB_00840 [Camelimonas abortus]|uniref:Uncharacterized protein n=1 Tax=Camelimonas abortus TaxID=1017184 RepID=A0ABV7LAG2_9HYPH
MPPALRPAPARALPQPQPPGFSLLRASLAGRLLVAALFCALIWAAIAGALWT